MKTKFYKRLVPIALIASMAVTNVGMTSASAQEVTGAVAGFTQSVDAPVVGAVGDLLGTPSDEIVLSTTKVGLINFTNQTKSMAAGETENLPVKLKNASSEEYYRFTNKAMKASNFVIADSAGKEQDTVSIVSIADGSGENESSTAFDNTITIKLEKAVEIETTFKLMVATEGSPNTWTEKGTIKITPKSTGGGENPQTQVAAGDGFRIPGGLTSKGTTVNAYAVGVTKVVSEGTSTEASTLSTDIKSEQIADTAKIAGEKATNAGMANHYVVWYNASGAYDKTTNVYIKVLSDDEAAKLPVTYKTETTLSDEEKAVLAEYIEQYAGKYYFATSPNWEGVNIPAGATIRTLADFETISELSKSYWAAKPAAITETAAKKITGTEDVQPGQVSLPAINAPEKSIKEDSELVKKIIEKYDAKHTSAKFNDQAAYVQQNDQEEEKDGEGKVTTPAIAKGTILEAGWTELQGFAAENLADCFGETDQYKAVAARATKIYVNYLNDQLYSTKNYDLSSINWVMETLPGDSETVTDKNGREKTNFTKTSGAAKFWGKAKATATADSAIAKAVGSSAKITNTKAAGKFNAAVYLKAVSSNYVPAKSAAKPKVGNVIFSQGVYITPAEPSRFADVKKLPNGMTAVAEAEAPSGVKEYSLTLDAGKSAKLPFALKDGQEKDLVYEVATGSSGFTVINGTVKGVDANEANLTDKEYVVGSTLDANVIKVYSRVKPSICAYVKVKVNAAIKSVRANTNALAIWPNSVQTISLGTVPATKPGDFQYQVVCSDTTNIELKQINASNEPADLTGGKFVEGNLLQVSVATGKKAADVKKNTTITVTLCDSAGKPVSSGGKEVKPLVIKLNPATAPQDVKSVKTAVKSKEILNNHKVINIPVGGAYNVGYSVSPATANGTIRVVEATVPEGQVDTTAASVSGDVIQGVRVGQEQIQFSLASGVTISDSFKSNEAEPTGGTIVYEVNVYEPGSSIVLTDSAYTIKGGFLMTTSAADTDCDKTFIASKKYIMSLPKTACTAGDGEEIVWTANNPSAVKFETHKVTKAESETAESPYNGKEENAEYLEITPCQTGTFTITGTTKYTKQKLAFKMLVGAANSAAATDKGTLDFSGGTVTPANSETPLDVAIGAGNKINAYYSSGTENVGGAVTFALKTATDKDKVTVSKTGLITAKSAGKVTVVATMMKDKTTKLCDKEFTVTVTAANVTPKSVIEPTKIVGGTTVGAAKGAKLSVALNNFDKKTMQLVWYTKKATGDTIELVNDNKNKLSGEVKPAAADDYKVYVRAFKSDASITAANVDVANDNACGEPICLGTVRVYAKGIKNANTDKGEKDTKTAIAALGAKVDESKQANAAGNGHTYYFPVFVKGTSDSDVPDAAKAGDMTFTVSNKSLATAVEFIPKNQFETYATAIGVSPVTGIKDILKSSEANFKQDTDIVKNYTEAYGLIKVETAATATDALSGVVTIKGTLVNSNKAVTIKLNLAGKAKDPATPYNPVEVTKGTPTSSATFSGVTKLAGDEIASGKTLQDMLNEATGKTYTEYKWVIVKPNSKKYTKDDIAEGFTLGAVNVNETTKVATVATIDAASAVKEGTYYLAKETIIHKIKTAYVAASGGKEAVNAVEDTNAAKYTVELASKTPIVVSVAE